MTEELIRRGEDTKGSIGLRLPRLRDKATPPRPVPALLADCGVLSRFCTARLRLEGFWPLFGADELDGGRRVLGSSLVSKDLGEMRPVWYDIACGSAFGGLDLLWGTRAAARPTRRPLEECGADRPPYDNYALRIKGVCPVSLRLISKDDSKIITLSTYGMLGVLRTAQIGGNDTQFDPKFFSVRIIEWK